MYRTGFEDTVSEYQEVALFAVFIKIQYIVIASVAFLPLINVFIFMFVLRKLF